MAEDVLKIRERKFQGETEVVSTRLPGDLVRELMRIAQQTGRSRNEIIEKCLTFAVNRIEVEKAD